jgi:hypothetical protein
MKISCIIISAFLLVGCASSRPSASLTAEQAKSLAMRLANDKAFTLYHCQPFRDGQPAHFVAGHWIWTDQQGFGHGDVQATVELAADGSTHSVDVQLLDSKNPVF